MKTLLFIALFFPLHAMAEVGRAIPQASDVEDPDNLRREFRRVSENVLPRSGGDKILYRDLKNERVGIGTITPQAGLDVASGGFGFPPATAIRGTITPGRAGIAYYNSTTANGEVCISTGTSIGAWVKMSSPGTACSN